MPLDNEADPEDLSSVELLAKVLEIPIAHAEQVYDYALQEYGAIVSFCREATDNEIVEQQISPQKIRMLRYAFALATKLPARNTCIDSPEDAVKVFDFMRGYSEEHFVAAMLTVRNTLITIKTLTIGNVEMSIVDPKQVIRAALKANAPRVILAHNHPSGDPNASDDDLECTERVIKACRVVGIDILDHIILGAQGYTSIRNMKPRWF